MVRSTGVAGDIQGGRMTDYSLLSPVLTLNNKPVWGSREKDADGSSKYLLNYNRGKSFKFQFITVEGFHYKGKPNFSLFQVLMLFNMYLSN